MAVGTPQVKLREAGYVSNDADWKCGAHAVLVAEAFRRVLDRLAPAVKSLMQRELATLIEDRRVALTKALRESLEIVDPLYKPPTL